MPLRSASFACNLEPPTERDPLRGLYPCGGSEGLRKTFIVYIMSGTSTTYIGYSPYDFYYVDALNRGADYAPNDASCNELIGNTSITCGDAAFLNAKANIQLGDNLDLGVKNCIQQQLCINKELAQDLELENSNNGGDQKILNFQDSYHNHLLKSANLGIGLCVIVYLLFRL